MILTCILVAIVIVTLVSIECFIHKQQNKWNVYISDAKTKLKNAGLRFNHSYRLRNKTTNTVAYIRIFEIRYSPNKNKVMIHAYLVSKNGEIGTWYDEYNYLLEIPKKWDIEDCGEWNAND